jgi:hypothetical protein
MLEKHDYEHEHEQENQEPRTKNLPRFNLAVFDAVYATYR